MDEQELEITIAPDGKVTMTTHGIKGPACMKFADMLVEIVGKEQRREKTPEFYETEQISTAQAWLHQRW